MEIVIFEIIFSGSKNCKRLSQPNCFNFKAFLGFRIVVSLHFNCSKCSISLRLSDNIVSRYQLERRTLTKSYRGIKFVLLLTASSRFDAINLFQHIMFVNDVLAESWRNFHMLSSEQWTLSMNSPTFHHILQT